MSLDVFWTQILKLNYGLDLTTGYFCLSQWSQCQIKQSRRHKFLLGSRPISIEDPGLEVVREAGQERCLKRAFVMFTYEWKRPTILLANIMKSTVEDVTQDRRTQKILTCLIIRPDAPSLSAAIKMFNNWPEFMLSLAKKTCQVRTMKAQFASNSCCIGCRATKCATTYLDGTEVPLDSQYHNSNM